LIGALPQPITSAPLVILIYAVLLLMVAGALASVLLRSTVFAVGAFAATMVLVALLYLTIAPFLLFAVQLLVFTTVSAALLVGLLRRTTGLDSTQEPFRREWIIGAAVAAAVLALLVVVAATTSWPLRATTSAGAGFGATLTNTYVVGLAVLVVILACAALGGGLLLAAPTLPSPRAGGSTRTPSPRGGGFTSPPRAKGPRR
jgi:NADH:ubiquinone oxidoreductase subunit 6 (subunit J)